MGSNPSGPERLQALRERTHDIDGRVLEIHLVPTVYVGARTGAQARQSPSIPGRRLRGDLPYPFWEA